MSFWLRTSSSSLISCCVAEWIFLGERKWRRMSAPAARAAWTARSCARFMESPLSPSRMHRDHEPTPSPSQEGNGQDADRYLFPSWEGLGVGRFMESPNHRASPEPT